MKPFVLLVVVGFAFGAPVDELQRVRKSNTETTGPCAGGAPVALYLGGSLPDTKREARSYYDAPGAGLASAGVGLGGAAAGLNLAAAAASASVGPTVGLFPNAKIGGCAVPLLLSCAPTVHSGHIAHAAAPSAYRADDHKRESTFESQWEAEKMRATKFDGKLVSHKTEQGKNQWEAKHEMRESAPAGKSQWEANHEMREALAPAVKSQWEGNHEMSESMVPAVNSQFGANNEMRAVGQSQWEANQEMREAALQNHFDNNQHELAIRPHHHHVLVDLHHNTQ